MKLAWVCFDTWSDELAAAAIESGAWTPWSCPKAFQARQGRLAGYAW